MSDQELIKLIHESVGEIFTNNKEIFIDQLRSVTTALEPSTQTQAQKLQATLFDYTLFVSELACVAMSKTLASMGILNISSSTDQKPFPS